MTNDQEEIKNQYAYSPFGRLLDETGELGLEQPFKYVGQFGVQHEQNNIYYMRARYYDAELGRFLKEDPIGFAGGVNVSLYVGGNPIVGIDPSGLDTLVIGADVRLPTFPGSPTIQGNEEVKPRGVSAGVAFSFPGINGGEFDFGVVGAVTVGGGIGLGTGRGSLTISAALGSVRDLSGQSIDAGINYGIYGVSAGIDENDNPSATLRIGPGFEGFVDASINGSYTVRDAFAFVMEAINPTQCRP